MTEHHPTTHKPPTARQQRYLRALAMERGISFTPPKTCAQASHLIAELKRQRPESRSDRRRETRAVQSDLAIGIGDGARVREEIEVTGYGSTATWKEVRS